MTQTEKIKIKAIAAMDESRVIGSENALPWDVPEDMKHFVRMTKGHTVLMGRKTFLSEPMNGRPLPKRKNVIVTRTPEKYTTEDLPDSVEYISDPIGYISGVRSGDITLSSDTLWVIGGAEIYSLTQHLWDEAHITIIKGEHPGDTHFPHFEENFTLLSDEDIGPCRFLVYGRS